MTHGLKRKIRITFLIQAGLVSIAICAAIFLISAVVKHSLVNAMLKEEAEHYWELYGASGVQPPPNTRNLRGYLLLKGDSPLALPEDLRDLSPGFHELHGDGLMVLVDERRLGRLYLVSLRSQVDQLAFWFGTVPIVLTLAVIYLVCWLTYKLSKRVLSPVNWLAQQVAQWDPRRPDAAALSAERLPGDVQGEIKTLAITLHDLAQRVSTQIERERDFTRDASHELRTPLTVIRVASDLALAEASTPRVVRSLHRIQRAGREMEAVIDAFLILARDSDVEPQRDTFDLAEVVLDEAESARDMLIGKPIDLEVTCNARPRLYASSRVMHVVISNLLRNACAYTDEGRIDVIVDTDRVTVRDTGIGMTEDVMSRAFEPFYRADESRPHGTGLGLSIVSRLCARFGWKVELTSALGQGTSAVIRFQP
ncbi:sensor histidine kinase [Pseudoxanthomonas composti]|uniref:histidine kinase n=1 Tax=Pseudoxanthomonas composti TaxID=2137479 RepID=A0A4Q1JVW1_9GAMM|nr:HAMP domain-containing sensor histidine kinase [Pseudoxanthomonas composti]RXR04349.1 HAMP domain-containing histidine kinase [Pseudoxanthomonas composti]